jgi:hypothetical protein
MSVLRCAASAASAGEPVASARRESVRETTKLTAIENASTAMPMPRRCTPVPSIRWRTASKAMTTLPTRISTPSMAAAMSSIFSWPYGCDSSAGTSAARTEKSATIEAMRSVAECSASVRSATEPVMVPAIALSRMSAEFEATESAAAPVFDGVLTRAPPRGGAGAWPGRRARGG